MMMTDVSKICIFLDRACDYIPIVSTATNLYALVSKNFFIPSALSRCPDNLYIQYLDAKDYKRSLLLIIPVLGNAIVLITDLITYFSPKKADAPPKIVIPTPSPTLTVRYSDLAQTLLLPLIEKLDSMEETIKKGKNVQFEFHLDHQAQIVTEIKAWSDPFFKKSDPREEPENVEWNIGFVDVIDCLASKYPELTQHENQVDAIGHCTSLLFQWMEQLWKGGDQAVLQKLDSKESSDSSSSSSEESEEGSSTSTSNSEEEDSQFDQVSHLTFRATCVNNEIEIVHGLYYLN